MPAPNDWDNPANWDSNMVPGPTDNVIIPAGTPTCTITGVATAQLLDIQGAPGGAAFRGRLELEAGQLVVGSILNEGILIAIGSEITLGSPDLGIYDTGYGSLALDESMLYGSISIGINATAATGRSVTVSGSIVNHGYLGLGTYFPNLPAELAIGSTFDTSDVDAKIGLHINNNSVCQTHVFGDAKLGSHLSIDNAGDVPPPPRKPDWPFITATGTISGWFQEGDFEVGNQGVWNKMLRDYKSGPPTPPQLLAFQILPVLFGMNINGVEGANVTTVGTFTDPGYVTPGPPPSNYNVEVYWDDGFGSTSQCVVSGGPTYTVSPVSPYAYPKDGTYHPQVVVTDLHDGVSFTFTGTATITEAPLSSSGIPFNGRAMSLAPTPPAAVANFIDGNSAAQASDFQATVNWGDGSMATPGEVQHVSGGSFQVVATHMYQAAGRYTFSVQIDESGGGMTTVATGTATISSSLLDEALAALSSATEPVVSDVGSILAAPPAALEVAAPPTGDPLAVGSGDSPVPAQAAPAAPPVVATDPLAVDTLFEQLTLAAT